LLFGLEEFGFVEEGRAGCAVGAGDGEVVALAVGVEPSA
jgi:hypothetical protein